MKIVVTGGAGYIGSTLTRMLAERGYQVVVLDRLFFGKESVSGLGDRVTIVRDDIRWCDPDLFRGVDAVMDLASLSNDPSGELDPQKTLDINCDGRVRVANLARKHSVGRYILASTCSVYGSSDEVSSEDSPLNPLTTYARANMMAEQEVAQIGGKSFCPTILRQATVYGASGRMRFDLAVNGMVLSLFKSGKVNIMRDGSQWRPFVHVADTSRAFIQTLEAHEDVVKGETFNVGSDDQNYRLFDLARAVAEGTGLQFDYVWYGSPDTRNYRVSFAKIRRSLSFKPESDPKIAAREMYDALRNGGLQDGPKTITVEWYKALLNNPELSRKVELNGAIL